MESTIGTFTFSSNFESGNLAQVQIIQPPGAYHINSPPSNNTRKVSKHGSVANADNLPCNYEFNLWTKPDCGGTEFQNNNKTWFFFSIKGGAVGDRVRLNVMNLNKQLKLYSQGMQPVVQAVVNGTKLSKWERIKEKCSYRSEESCTVISWVHTVQDDKNPVYYAFTYPFTYTELQKMLANLKKRFPPDNPSLYYHCELLAHSLDNRRLDLITVTSHKGKEVEREDKIPGLFPDSNDERPHRFRGKKFVFISARVHPGETPSSFVFNGFLSFIVSNDERALKLRDKYVFKMIPMLNPDGVVRGHYRSDQRGVNLNRVYINPSYKFHPTIYAARQIILYYHRGAKLSSSDCEDLEGNSSSVTGDTESSDVTPSSHKVLPPELDEDTCHSFSDVGGTIRDNNASAGVTSYMEMDEPSASGWDISSNISHESSANIYNHNIDVHDDCSNFSGISEAETGVTSMFNSLAKVSDFSGITSDSLNKTDKSSFISTKLETLSEMNELKTHVDENQKITCNKCQQKNDELGESIVKCNCDVYLPLKREYILSNEKSCAKNIDSLIEQKNIENTNLTILNCNKPNFLSPTSFNSPPKPNIKSPSKIIFPTINPSNTSTKDTQFMSSSESEAECGKPNKEAELPELVVKSYKFSPSNVLTPSPEPNCPSGLHLYVDLHGHASKRGIFLYGNWYSEAAMMVENMMFPKLLSLNCPNFDFAACNFSERNMYLKDRRDGMSKEGSGRVAIMRATGLLRSYTLECNYNTGRTFNPTPPSPLDRKVTHNLNGLPPKYNPSIFEDCGKQLAVSLLDESGDNPAARVNQSQYGNLMGVRSWLHHFLTSSSLSPRMNNSINLNVPSSRATSAKQSPKISSSKSPNKMSVEKLEGARLNLPKRNAPGAASSPRSRNRSARARRHSWCMSVDSENQEPSENTRPSMKKMSPGGFSPRSKARSTKFKLSSPKKSNASRSLTFTELGEGSNFSSSDVKIPVTKMSSSKHSLTASVSLTPNLNVKLSISDSSDNPTLVKKVEKIRRQRCKSISGGSKKLKISPTCSTAEETSLKSKDALFGLPNLETNEFKMKPLSPSQQESFYINTQSPLSPRSPLSSVCEPQTSHSPGSLGVIATTPCDLHIQPKSPSVVTTKKIFHSPTKRSSKHSLKSLSKSMDRLPAVGNTGERLKLLPKKMKKKGNARSVNDLTSGISTSPMKATGSQPTLEWIINEPPKTIGGDIDIVAPKVKKRKKNNRKSL